MACLITAGREWESPLEKRLILEELCRIGSWDFFGRFSTSDVMRGTCAISMMASELGVGWIM